MKKILYLSAIILLLASGCNSSNTMSFRKPSAANKIVSTPPAVQAVAPMCLPGFIKVPASSLYNTPDFCVMKYDAKVALISNPTVGLSPKLGDPCDGESSGISFGTYKNNGTGCAAISQSKEIVSVASGYPLAYIPEIGSGSENATSYCNHMGWHLITNAEWMTIARNVEQVSANWCSPDGTDCGNTLGAPGKILASGHSHAQPNQALVASEDDSQACFGTATDGSNNCGAPNSQKRTLTLSNSQVIWDFAGNVWQWVAGTVLRKDEPQSVSNGKSDIGWLSSDFAPGATQSVIINNGQGPVLGYNSFRPSNSNWNSNNGVGKIFHYSSINDTNTTIYGLIRGGQWNHGAVDGAFSMHLTPVPNKTNIDDVGFRCVETLQ